MSGAFQMDRGIFQNSIWNNIAEFRVFFYIVGNAVWKKEGTYVGNIHIKRGQYLRSYRNLREDLMYMENNAVKYYSVSYIKTVTDKLVSDGRLEKEETKLGTLFTIVNYSKYQGFNRFDDDNREQTENGLRTAKEQGTENGEKTGDKQVDNNDIREQEYKTENEERTGESQGAMNNKKNKNKEIYIDIVEYLNQQTNKSFKHTTKATKSKINARLEEGFTLDDFKKVIDIKTGEWLNDTNMQKYLRPETLFGTKFESYLNENVESNSQAKPDSGRRSDRRL